MYKPHSVVVAALLAAFAAAVPAGAGDLAEPMAAVESVRGLKFLHPVREVMIDRSELPARLETQINKEMPYSFDDYTLILRSLQLIEPHVEGHELMPQLLGLLQQQVLAFYDPEADTFYNVRQGGDASAGIMSGEVMQQAVVIHELVHALQDQRFDIGRKARLLRLDNDASMAYHAVIEGEATLVMLAQMLQQAGASIDAVVGNDTAINAMSQAAGSTMDTGGAPKYFAETLKFPYLEGLKFCIAAYRRGGWKEFDKVHANPPLTTREVLQPSEYFARIALTGANAKSKFDPTSKVKAPHLLTVEHLGEFHWAFLAGAENSRGWVDDRVTVVQDEFCEPTVLAETRWETPARATAFRKAYIDFLDGRDLEPRVQQDGAVVKVAYGADYALIESFVEGR